MNIMLDIETLGNRPGSMILAIGAVAFPLTSWERHSFYGLIEPASAEKIGCGMDVDTVLWWMRQSEEARMELASKDKEKRYPVENILIEFARFIQEIEKESGGEVKIWGNGASFDCVLLREVYRLAKITVPWKYYNERCYRTVKALYPEVKMRENQAKHNALADAEAQALHLLQICNETGLKI